MKHSACQPAIADLLAIRDKYNQVTVMALVFVSAFHFVHPLALLRQAEKEGIAREGAASRLSAKGPDWEDLALEMFEKLNV